MPAMAWLSESESRVGLGCMRLSTDEDRDEERAYETIAAAADAGVTVFDTARAYGDNEQASRQGASALRRGRERADRDQGRHEPARRRVGARWPGSLDPRGLRGEPRSARRPPDRPLSPPRAGSAHAVADLGSCAREARRRRPRRPRRRLEREPRSARRGARARSDRGRPGRPQPVRRSGASRRRRRPLRGRRAHLHRALAARRAAPGEGTRSQRVTRRGRRGTRRAGRGDRPRLDPRSRSERGRDPGRTPTRLRALRCARRLAPSRRLRARAAAFRTGAATRGEHGSPSRCVSRRRRRDGRPRSREDTSCRGVHRARVRPAESRRARRHAS